MSPGSTPAPIPTRVDDVVDVLHGVEVPHPYRWLESGDAPEVREWVAAQNARTRVALDAAPERDAWHERLVALMRLPVVQAAQVRGDRLILLERESGAQQARLVARSLGEPSGAVVVLADPASAAADDAAAVDWFEASPDGSLVAFGVSEGGTESSVLHVGRTLDGGDLGEAIPNCRAASVAWDPDGGGFHYTRYPEGDEYHRTVHHHTLGADWRDDPIVWAEHPTPQTWPIVTASSDGRHLLVTAMVGWSRTDVHLLDRTTGEWTTVVAGIDAVTWFDLVDGQLLGSTTLDAPRGRVVAAALDAPSDWTTVVAEREVVIGSVASLGGGRFALTVSERGVDRIEIWHDGDAVTVDGLGPSAVVGLSADDDTGVGVAVVTGFDRPPAVVRFDAGVAATIHPSDGKEPDAERVELAVRHVEYDSLDGTTVGLFLVHAADLMPGPDTPTILNGYGGFGITESPTWSPMIAAWCADGGLYAIAQLRGGGEHGEEWHAAGKRANKQNVFDDFHAAADFLVDTGLTSRDRLAIAGGSNGGLLVGAALTQRPDLCRAVWCAVPLLDMIRFPHFLIARLWTDEYGDPDDAEQFEWLWSYSPYHHVHDGTVYPAVLFTTAEGDTRVDPLHARKMAALLQACAAGQDERPVLLSQEGRAGHGAGKPVGKRADEAADVLAFFTWQLGLSSS
jgi:prolyl oligopeptidase